MYVGILYAFMHFFNETLMSKNVYKKRPYPIMTVVPTCYNELSILVF